MESAGISLIKADSMHDSRARGCASGTLLLAGGAYLPDYRPGQCQRPLDFRLPGP